MFEDKTLVCRECGNEFIFTASEQQFYADKGFQNEPGRCKACRDKRKAANGGFGRSDRPMYDVVCAECGQPTQVPFQPRGDRPVYCRDCFEKQRMEIAAEAEAEVARRKARGEADAIFATMDFSSSSQSSCGIRSLHR